MSADAVITRAQAEARENQIAVRRRWPRLLIALLLLGALGAGACYLLARAAEDETDLVLYGNIDVRQVNLAFKVEGRIDQLAVDEGDAVKAGQVIARLDKRYFHDDLRVARAKRDNLAASLAKLVNGSRPEEIAQARAQTAAKEATLAQARADYERYQELDKTPGAVSKQDLVKYASQLAVAQADVKAARESQRLIEIGPRREDIDAARTLLAQQDATIVQTERRLADSDVLAPNDGIILTRAREKGAIVQAGETVFTLTLASPVWVRTYVNERDLGLAGPGTPAAVATDTAPDRPYSGHIGFISPTAEFTPKTVETRELRTDLVYRLRVIVDNPDGGLRQGMPVTVRLPLPQPRPRTFWERLRSALSFQ
jgi:HlyD family secretion protein